MDEDGDLMSPGWKAFIRSFLARPPQLHVFFILFSILFVHHISRLLVRL